MLKKKKRKTVVTILLSRADDDYLRSVAPPYLATATARVGWAVEQVKAAKGRKQ